MYYFYRLSENSENHFENEEALCTILTNFPRL